MIVPTQKRLYYVPGMISLLALVIFLKWYSNRFEYRTYDSYPFAVPDSREESRSLVVSRYQIEKDISKKKQIQIMLDENEAENSKKFDLIKYEARKLKYTHDTLTVLRISFTEKMNYGQFIQLIRLCNADGHRRFALLNKSFVIWGEWPAKPSRL
jgi:hypothetical protein